MAGNWDFHGQVGLDTVGQGCGRDFSGFAKILRFWVRPAPWARSDRRCGQPVRSFAAGGGVWVLPRGEVGLTSDARGQFWFWQKFGCEKFCLHFPGLYAIIYKEIIKSKQNA